LISWLTNKARLKINPKAIPNRNGFFIAAKTQYGEEMAFILVSQASAINNPTLTGAPN